MFLAGLFIFSRYQFLQIPIRTHLQHHLVLLKFGSFSAKDEFSIDVTSKDVYLAPAASFKSTPDLFSYQLS